MAPKTSEQFQEIRQQSMDAIMQAALELFGHDGYHSTSISKIAKEAGVSKGLMYNYFDSKEDLLKRIILEAIETGEHFVDEALDQSSDPYQQLQNLITFSIDMIKTNLPYWKLVTSLAFQGDVLDPIKEVLEEKHKTAIQMGVTIFTKMGLADPLKEALFFGAVMDGMLVHFMQMGETYPMDEMKDFVVKRFCTPK